MLPTGETFRILSAFMSELAVLTSRLKAGQSLTDVQIAAAVEGLTEAVGASDPKADFLRALAEKGETPAEVAGFARMFRERAVDPGVQAWAGEAIDVVGTGGDHAGAFNISSMVVLTLACAGVKVMKHGNRGITSKCGSADLLAGLGVNIEASPEKARAALEQLGFVFFFAPAYHPTFKHIAPARKLLAAEGRRSVFNILGPLINPGRPKRILLGVFAERWVPVLAEVLELLGAEAGLAAHAILGPDKGIDEMTTATPNRVKGIGRIRDVDTIWRAEDHGLTTSPVTDLGGGDLAENLAIVEAILAGRGPAGLVDTIVFNAAAGLWVCGRVPSIADGVGLGRELLLGGAVKTKIADARAFFGTK